MWNTNTTWIVLKSCWKRSEEVDSCISSLHESSYGNNDNDRKTTLLVLSLSSSYQYVWVILLFVMIVLQECCGVLIMYVLSDFYSSISTHNDVTFRNTLLRATVIVLLTGSIKSLGQLCGDCCRIQWRFNLVTYIHRIYLGDEQESSVCTSSGLKKQRYGDDRVLIEDCDQRIVQDSALFADRLATLTSKMIVSPGIIAFYTIYLCILFGAIVPGVCFAYFILSTIAVSPLMQSVTGSTSSQDRLEGDFRFLHSKCRINIECIDFLGGRADERSRMNSSFLLVICNGIVLMWKKFCLAIVSNISSYSGAIVSYLSIGIALMFMHSSHNPTGGSASESDTAALLARGSYACMYLIGAMTSVVESAGLFAELLGYGNRIGEYIMQLCDDTHIEGTKKTLPGVMASNSDGYELVSTSINMPLVCSNDEILDSKTGGILDTRQVVRAEYLRELCLSPESPSTIVDVRNIAIATPPPSNRLIITCLSFQLLPGVKLLITGKSGCGKSSLLRVLAGLWDAFPSLSSGDNASHIRLSFSRPSVHFFSQIPYMFKGTLVEYFLYACRYFRNPKGFTKLQRDSNYVATETDLQSMRRALLDVELYSLTEFLLSKINELVDWDVVLSNGEKQRLCVARVLALSYRDTSCRRTETEVPNQLVVLDEATASVDEAMQSLIYMKLSTVSQTIISVGHRASLRKLHTHELCLDNAPACVIPILSTSNI